MPRTYPPPAPHIRTVAYGLAVTGIVTACTFGDQLKVCLTNVFADTPPLTQTYASVHAVSSILLHDDRVLRVI